MRLFGLIGNPLTHSFSAHYFAKKFEQQHITDAEYRLFPLSLIQQLTSLVATGNLMGFNVTIPYKVAVMPFLDELTAEAAAIGAVNCVKIDRQGSGVKLSGHNTDVYGFRESMAPLLKPYHTHALVLGTGGASKAICYALKQAGIAYTLVSRRPQHENEISYSQLNGQILSDKLLIINTTPLGTYPNSEQCPDIPYPMITSRHLLYDLVYNPAETLFMQQGIKRGATVTNGLRMLELQAEKSWEIWNS